MIYLKNILLILAIVFFYEDIYSHDQIDFEPLKTLEKEKPNTSKKKLNHIYKFSLLYSIGKETLNTKIITVSRNFNQSAYVSLLLIKKKDAEALRKQVSDFIEGFVKIYRPIIENKYSRNNNHIIGSLILEEDFDSCKKFSPKANNFLRQNGFQVLK